MPKALIHCITNPISMNQCANTVLALGAKPIMAEHPLEVEEITDTADALLLNLGNISDTRMEAMKLSLEVAKERGIPVVIDAVGVACSRLRRSFLYELLEIGGVTLIKGNYAEILAIYDEDYRAPGVDSEETMPPSNMEDVALSLSTKLSAIILATGKTDVVAAFGSAEQITGGCEQMSALTGTGCMLGALLATLLTKDRSIIAVAEGVRFFDECGSKAATKKGIGSYMTRLLDALGGYIEQDYFFSEAVLHYGQHGAIDRRIFTKD